MPRAYIRVDSLIGGTYTITGNVHPAGAKVTCMVKTAEYTVEANYDNFEIKLKEPLTPRLMVRFTVEKDGWMESNGRVVVE